MPLDAREMQLASAIQRFNTLQRRAASHKEPAILLSRTLEELGRALEEVRAAQEQLVESRARIEQLQEQVREEAERYWRLFDEIPQAYVVTKPDSTIVEANRAASELFNVSQRFLVGKTLSVFVCEDRSAFLQTSARVAIDSATAELTLKLRPRERAPLAVQARVSGASEQLRWLLKQIAGSAIPQN